MIRPDWQLSPVKLLGGASGRASILHESVRGFGALILSIRGSWFLTCDHYATETTNHLG